MTNDLDGIVADRTCDACPTQYEGEIDGLPFYFRARWGRWTLTVVTPRENPIGPKDRLNIMYQAERAIDETDDSGFNGVMPHDAVVIELIRARDTLRNERFTKGERMTKLEKSKSTLVHYIRTLFEANNLKWDSDNVTEVEGIVDDIAAGVRREIEEQEEDAEEIRSRIRDAREGRG